MLAYSSEPEGPYRMKPPLEVQTSFSAGLSRIEKVLPASLMARMYQHDPGICWVRSVMMVLQQHKTYIKQLQDS